MLLWVPNMPTELPRTQSFQDFVFSWAARIKVIGFWVKLSLLTIPLLLECFVPLLLLKIKFQMKFKLLTILVLSNLIAEYNLQAVGLSLDRIILYNYLITYEFALTRGCWYSSQFTVWRRTQTVVALNI